MTPEMPNDLPITSAPALASASGSEVKCKCADCGKEIIYSTIQLCDDCYNYRCDVEMQEDDGLCDRCNGEGEIMVCIDDICHGQGECIHGDGYALCPNCKGSGDMPRQAKPPNAPGEPQPTHE